MTKGSRWLGIIAIAAVIVCMGACAVVGISLRYGEDILLWVEKQNALRLGSPAPDFTLPALGASDVRLSQYRGQPVLLTFAASWCPACREEAPYQQALHAQYPELVVVLVDSNEQESVVRGFADEFGMTFPVLLDASGTVSLRYRIFSIPTSFFIDPNGVIQYAYIGGLSPELMAGHLPLIGVEP